MAEKLFLRKGFKRLLMGIDIKLLGGETLRGGWTGS
jgi:hypothetical protein